MKRLIKLAALFLLVGVVLLGAGVGWAYWRYNSDPAYWNANEDFLRSRSSEGLDQLAASVERRFTSQASAARPLSTTRDLVRQGMAQAGSPDGAVVRDAAEPKTGEGAAGASIDQTPRTISVTLEEANAWLATRADAWLRNQGLAMPPGVSEPMISVEDGNLVAAFRLQRGRIDRPISMVLDVAILPDGQARTRLLEMRGGELPLPVNKLADRFKEQASPRQREMIEKAMQLYDGHTFDPIFELDAKRDLRVTNLQLSRSSVELTVKPIPR